MNKLLIICGPTAGGKTLFALSLAKKLKGELVSADSRQVYRGMDVVTGKEADKKIRTWLLDIVDPDYNFNVSDYYNLAWQAILDIWQRGKLPILVGGTGFYIKAVVDGIETIGVTPNIELRQELSVLSVELLGQKLKKLDPKRWQAMNESDRQNPRRLVRAIEVVTHKFKNQKSKVKITTQKSKILWIGLKIQKDFLHKQINKRVDERIRQGAVGETKKLAKRYGWNEPSMSGIGYRQLRDYIEGKISLAEAVDRWKLAEHEYASKQMTWFKKEKRIAWLVVY